MPTCARCGAENPGTARFCQGCGQPLAVQAPTQVRKTVTLVFSDVSGSTSIGEQHDPEAVRGVMGRYFEEMRAVIERHGGFVEKFVGDAVLAAFGIPVVHEDDVIRAVRAAAEMRETLSRLNDEMEADWGVRIAARIGVNTGEVVAGDPSARETFATGDTVNTAARLEQAAGPDEILLGPLTYRLVRDAVSAEPTEPLTLKGKAESLEAYRLLEVQPLAAGRIRRQLSNELIGRDRELAELHDEFVAVTRDRRCALVTIVGAAGVGKSRLTEELLGRLRDATTLRGRCLSYGEGITFWPIVEIVSEAAGIEERDDLETLRAKLEASFADAEPATLERLMALLGAPDRGATLAETFLAIRRALESAARDRPLAILVEDVHWGEPPLLDLLAYLRDLGDGPILVVCTARPEPNGDPSRARGNAGRVISLDPLTPAQIGRLVEGSLGSTALEAVRDRIVSRAEGNPLFATEMLGMLIDDERLIVRDGRWTLEEPTDDLVPPTISALISARLDRLPMEHRSVMEAAAVVGTEIERPALASLAGDEVALEPILGQLRARDLLVTSGAGILAFRHVLIREETYAAATKDRRGALHERYAGWLEASLGDRLGEQEEMVGFHLEQAFRYRVGLHPEGEPERALAARAAKRLSSAGLRAQARGDAMATVNLLSRAAALLPETDGARLTLLPELGDALTDSGDLAGASSVLADARRLAESSGDERLEALIRLSQLRVLRQTDPEGVVDQTRAEADRCLAIFERAQDDRGLARAFAELAGADLMHLRCDAAVRSLERSLASARRCEDRQLQSLALQWLPAALVWGPRPLTSCVARLEAILVQGAGNPLVQASADGMLALASGMLGRFEGARERFDSHQRALEDLGHALMAKAGPAQPRAMLEFAAGDPAAAEVPLRDAFDALERLGERSFLSTIAVMLADALFQQGRFDEVEGFLRAGEDAASSDDVLTHVWAKGVGAKILTHRRQHDAARRLAEEAVTRARTTDSLLLQAQACLDQAYVLAAARDNRKAARSVREAIGLFERKGNVVQAARARALAGIPP